MDAYRTLAKARPEAFLPDLAMSLPKLGAHLSDVGQREAARERLGSWGDVLTRSGRGSVRSAAHRSATPRSACDGAFAPRLMGTSVDEGSVKLGRDGRLKGKLKIKDGDESTFVAERSEEPDEPIPDPPSYRDKWKRRR